MIAHPDHTTRTIEIQSRTDLLGDVRDFVSAAARAAGFGDDDIAKIALAVDEACTNIIKHAYRYNPEGRIRVSISRAQADGNPDRFIVIITDNGIAFDRASYVPPDMHEYFQKLRRGGLGIVLMTKLMDAVEYESRPGAANAIRLIKFLPPTVSSPS